MDDLKWIIWGCGSLPLDKAATQKSIGGKAQGLYHLRSLGIPVPPWVTITSSFFKHLCLQDNELGRLLGLEMEDHSEKGSLVRDRIKHMKIRVEEDEVLSEVWRKMSDEGIHSLAVRSSAVDEDGRTLSFAGQMDTVLNVKQRQDLIDAVRCCWASLFGDRAITYALQHGIHPWARDIAVVVQQMIEPEVSGVLFTANPLTGNRNEMVVNSTWGLGEGLVSGLLNGDMFILDTRGRILTSEVREKKQCMVSDQEGTTRIVEVAADKQAVASLKEDQLRRLHHIASEVERYHGTPMDIEFGVVEDVIYLLQARPITHLGTGGEGERDNRNVWDNSNIVESYSGVTTPLTFSFIKRAYAAVYTQFCEVIGVDRRTIAKNRSLFENMLGLIHGRVYYNLLNWYRLVSLMPGFRYNKAFMEQMMGLHVTQDIPVTQEKDGRLRRYFIDFPKLVKVGLHMAMTHLTLQRRIAKFHAHFDQVRTRYSDFQLSTLTPAQLLIVYRFLEDEILQQWKAPILNDFEAMIFYGLLRRLGRRWNLDEDGMLQNDLLCDQGGIKSTEVTTELIRIADRISSTVDLRDRFLRSSPQEILENLREDPALSEVNRAFEEYLKIYGVRCMEEMKLESIPIRDNPAPCISMIQNYMRQPQLQRNGVIRPAAEVVLKERLRGKRILFLIPKLWIYKWILRNARRAIRNRENQRFARAEAYALARGVFRTIAKHWENEGILEKSEDIFYLETDEVWSFIEGTSTCVNLKALVRLRKEEFEAYRTAEPADHIETYGEVYHQNVLVVEKTAAERSQILIGTGCCRGVVEGTIRVVTEPDPTLRLRGEILVARQTDPGWVVLFPSISGLVVEKGSMLSHSAIVAREMGIPTVVGVRNATEILRTGYQARLNGSAGTVEILKRPEE